MPLTRGLNQLISTRHTVGDFRKYDSPSLPPAPVVEQRSTGDEEALFLHNNQHQLVNMAGPGKPPRISNQIANVADYQGFHPHPPSLFHRGMAKALGAGMWFFIFYRAR